MTHRPQTIVSDGSSGTSDYDDQNDVSPVPFVVDFSNCTTKQEPTSSLLLNRNDENGDVAPCFLNIAADECQVVVAEDGREGETDLFDLLSDINERESDSNFPDVELQNESQDINWMKGRFWSIPLATDHIIALVTHTEPELNLFYAQPLVLRSLVEERSRLLNMFYSMLSTDELIPTEQQKSTTGTLCATKWSEDDMWYRAEILQGCNDSAGDSLTKVRFIDYGNCDTVPTSSLHTLIKAFSTMPPAALVCRDDGLQIKDSQQYFQKIEGNTVVLKNTTRSQNRTGITSPAEPLMVNCYWRQDDDCELVTVTSLNDHHTESET